MPWRLKENQILMYRPHLQNIPVPRLPPGYQELENNEELLSQWADLLNEVFEGYSVERLRGQVLDEPQWRPDRVILAGKGGCRWLLVWLGKNLDYGLTAVRCFGSQCSKLIAGVDWDDLFLFGHYSTWECTVIGMQLFTPKTFAVRRSDFIWNWGLSQ